MFSSAAHASLADALIGAETEIRTLMASPRPVGGMSRAVFEGQWAALEARVEAKICQASRLLAISDNVT
jgi:hypothetical protein